MSFYIEYLGHFSFIVARGGVCDVALVLGPRQSGQNAGKTGVLVSTWLTKFRPAYCGLYP